MKQLFHSHFGYEMIIANSALRVSLAIYHLTSNKLEWNNCIIVYSGTWEVFDIASKAISNSQRNSKQISLCKNDQKTI